MENKSLKEIKIKRTNPNGVIPVHVNDMLVSHDGKEFFLQFLEIEPPALFDMEEFNKLESLEAIVKVKLVVSPEFMDAMVKALAEAFEKFKLARKLSDE